MVNKSVILVILHISQIFSRENKFTFEPNVWEYFVLLQNKIAEPHISPSYASLKYVVTSLTGEHRCPTGNSLYPFNNSKDNDESIDYTDLAVKS